jgi:nucleotide-binding universal stress UspA family protein
MFQKLLLPLDGSDIAEIALPYGEEIAGKLDSELVLYHVHSPEHLVQEHMSQVYLESIARKVQSHIGNARITVSTRIESGEVTNNICNFVNENGVDLIVMTSVSRSGYKIGKTLGSITDNVCRKMPIPVVLIRPRDISKHETNGRLLKRILVPLDGSELSKLALPVAEELALKLKLNITLFRMVTIIHLSEDKSSENSNNIYAEFNEKQIKKAQAELVEIESRLKQHGIEAKSIVVSGSDAAGEIIDFCKKASIDLVVMSTHGRTGLNRWIFGNIAEKVLRQGESHLLLVNAAPV